MADQKRRIINHSTQNVPVEELIVYEGNPRIGDLQAIIESIEQNGFYGSLIVQRSTGRILVGNHRYRAALELGYEELPVTYVEVSDERAAKLLLIDNRAGDLATAA